MVKNMSFNTLPCNHRWSDKQKTKMHKSNIRGRVVFFPSMCTRNKLLLKILILVTRKKSFDGNENMVTNRSVFFCW